MRAAARFIASAFALSMQLGLSPAAAGHMTDFDLDKLGNWADAIAVCDVTRFLLTDPDTRADAIVIPGRGNTRVALYKPLYQPPANFFSDVMRQTFEHVQKSGLVTLDAYSQARVRYAGLMIAAYSGATLAEKHYMSDQMELCYRLATRAGVTLTPAMRKEP
jgi:hypothetical protein